MRRRLAVALLALALCGAAALPVQVHLAGLRSAAGLGAEPLGLDLRERVGQLAFVAALSGFRSFVAALAWIEAHIAWQNTEWGRMTGLITTATSLQPRSALYWDNGSWHLAWNAAINARNNEEAEPSEALRIRAERQYVDLGRQLLEEGIQSNPDNPMLRERLGLLLSQRAADHCAAAEAYAEAAKTPGARPYVKRLAAYELAQCPGREQDAYEALRTLYDLGPEERTPSVLARLRELEEKLGIPPEKRIETESSP